MFSIKKIGHSCLIYEKNTVRILIDPGSWNIEQNEEKNISAIFVTHKHADHLNADSIQAVLKNNPGINVYCADDVGAELAKSNIPYMPFHDEDIVDVKGVKVEGVGKNHAPIYPTIPDIQNTGMLIDGEFYHPGDSLVMPKSPVKVFAFPVISPWNTLQMSIDHTIKLAPKFAFNIHDGMLRNVGQGIKGVPKDILAKHGISYDVIEDGGMKEFE